MKLKFFLLIAVFVVILPACSFIQKPTPGTDNKLPPNKVVQEPSKGGEISIGIDIEQLKLDPLKYQFPKAAIYDLDAILYRGLLKYDEKLQLSPDLAESFTINKEQKQVEIKLKNNIKWQDGSSISLEDIKYSIEWYSRNDYHGRWRDYTFSIVGTDLYRMGKEKNVTGIVTSQSEQIIIIKFNQLTNNELQLLRAPILSKIQLTGKNIEEVKDLAKAGKLYVSGPYTIEGISNDKIVLARNEAYDGNVYLDRVTFTDYNNRDNELAIALPQDATNNIRKDKIVTLHGQGYQYLGMNLNQEKWKDASVRKGIALALDYNLIIKKNYDGYADKPLSTIHPESWAYSAANFNTNTDEAKKLLEGKQLNLKLSYEDQPLYQNLAEEISNQLSLYGITVSLNPIPREQFFPSLFSNGDYELFLASWPYELDPSLENLKWLSVNDVNLGGFNVSHINDEKADLMLLNGKMELNNVERKNIYHQWQEYFMNQHYIMPIASSQIILFEDPILHAEITNSMVPYYNLHNWWIEK